MIRLKFENEFIKHSLELKNDISLIDDAITDIVFPLLVMMGFHTDNIHKALYGRTEIDSLESTNKDLEMEVESLTRKKCSGCTSCKCGDKDGSCG